MRCHVPTRGRRFIVSSILGLDGWRLSITSDRLWPRNNNLLAFFACWNQGPREFYICFGQRFY